MSSWGLGNITKLPYLSEFSNLWFYICHFRFRWSLGVLKIHPFFFKLQKLYLLCKIESKSSLFKHTYTCFNFRNHARNYQLVKALCPYNVSSGPTSRHLHARSERPICPHGRTDWRSSKVSFNFFFLKYVNKHVLSKFYKTEKIVKDFSMGLIFGFEVGGGGELFLKLH